MTMTLCFGVRHPQPELCAGAGGRVRAGLCVVCVQVSVRPVGPCGPAFPPLHHVAGVTAREADRAGHRLPERPPVLRTPDCTGSRRCAVSGRRRQRNDGDRLFYSSCSRRVMFRTFRYLWRWVGSMVKSHKTIAEMQATGATMVVDDGCNRRLLEIGKHSLE